MTPDTSHGCARWLLSFSEPIHWLGRAERPNWGEGELTMRWIEDPQLTHLLNSARASAEHPGYVALQPIIDLLEAALDWLQGKRPTERKSRTSLPPL